MLKLCGSVFLHSLFFLTLGISIHLTKVHFGANIATIFVTSIGLGFFTAIIALIAKEMEDMR